MGEEKNIIGQLFVNGQPLTIVKEVEFTNNDAPKNEVIHPEPTELTFEIEPNECTAAALKEMFQEAEMAYKLMAAAVIATWLWKCSQHRRQYHSNPKRTNRTRKKQRLTRLQRRRKRQNKSKTKRR